MAYVVAVVVGLAFGAADQYLGTIRFDPWAWTVSGMSAPWLVLPFVVGMTQERARRAIALGLVVTVAALVGYFAMTYSPMESIPVNEFFTGFFRVVRSGYNPVWIAGGVVIGPLYGYLGVTGGGSPGHGSAPFSSPARSVSNPWLATWSGDSILIRSCGGARSRSESPRPCSSPS